jgi:hypothetical protein
VCVKFLSVGAELGSVRSVFYEVHCAAFDVFVFVSKRLGAGGQLGMFGCNIVPIIQRSFLPVVRERGDHAAPSEPVSATTFRSTTRERDFRGTTGPPELRSPNLSVRPVVFHDVLLSVFRDTHDMSVLASEPAIHRQSLRELATNLPPILVADAAHASDSRDHTDVIHIGTSGRPGDEHIA